MTCKINMKSVWYNVDIRSSTNKLIVYEIALNFIWVYIFHCTFNIMTLIVKIHRCWHFMLAMTPSEYTLCRYTTMQKLTFFMWCRRQSSCHILQINLPNITIYFFSHVLPSIQKSESIYTRITLYLQCLNYTKCIWSICQNSAWEDDLRLVQLVFISFMYVYLHVLQVEYHDPVMKCCMQSKICGIHTMQHYTDNNYNNNNTSS